MSTQPRVRLTPEEYLERERRAERKSEYLAGEVFAMAGAGRRHVLAVTNLARELSSRLRDVRCEVYSTDMRLRVSPAGLYTYPDVMVVCGEPRFADDQRDTLLNPVVIIEVLSESTKDYDRGEKFRQYRSLPSLAEYVVVAQDAAHVEHWARRPDGTWVLTETDELAGAVRLESIGVTVPMAEIYLKVPFDAA
jgi:Uma2 family endonuclease